jgi:hypothetical protein
MLSMKSKHATIARQAVTPLPSEKEGLWRRTMRSLVPSVVLQPQENSPLKRLAQLQNEYVQYYSANANRVHYTYRTPSLV